ncbi:MAG TPA: FMN-binding negative transcriptional regulator [Verrucomicrobiae bacterium]|nr:FMN-binding negative transcriptional regulator [Verrucomicrobiae bacterium]
MYTPPHFAEDRPQVLQDFIGRNPLATLVTLSSSGLIANHVPLLLDADPAPHGKLIGHLARANNQWRDFDERVEALAIFTGPQAYVSPSWYATKAETGKVVPTWNYAAVHAYGALRVIDDAGWLRNLVGRLTDRHEGTRSQPWKVEDAPAVYIQSQLKGIIGIELTVQRFEGKWKLSQNRPERDRQGTVRGLDETGDADAAALAKMMADLPR